MGKVLRPRSKWSKKTPQAAAAAAGELQLQTCASQTAAAAADFGHIVELNPCAVFHPSTAEDIAALARAANSASLTLAPRGNGHSIHGQAMAPGGIVIDMQKLLPDDISIVLSSGSSSSAGYVEASGGALWVRVLEECLKRGVAPKSWTDYLYLTVGGTLSNAGVSGQCFLHGPQISNVLQMEVVTGKGDVVSCSPKIKSELFYAALGGLGQFGIITKARIEVEEAPDRARYVRLLYSDFESFKRDIEFLISQKDLALNYVEGSVVPNTDDPSQGYPSVPFAGQVIDPELIPQAPVLYCIEVAKYYSHCSQFLEQVRPLRGSSGFSTLITRLQELNSFLGTLNCIPSLVFSADLTYFDFLNRVKPVEDQLRKLELWEVPHPWLILFVPGSKISTFNELVILKLLSKGVNGPMLVYPMNRSKWETRCSAVVPEENVFYMVGLLRYVVPSMDAMTLDDHLHQNSEILRTCEEARIGAKQYFPHYTTEAEWKHHFGNAWAKFQSNKLKFDPNAILSPGQRIFTAS